MNSQSVVISPLNRSGNSEITYFAACARSSASRSSLCFKRGVGLVALDERDVTPRVMADAGGELDRIRQFDEVVVRSEHESFRLHLGLLLGGENDGWNFSGRGIRPIKTQHRQAIDLGHDEVLKNDRRTKFRGGFHRFRRIGAVSEIDIRFRCKHSADGFANHGLVVHEKHADAARLLRSNTFCGGSLRLIVHGELLLRAFCRGRERLAARLIASAILSRGRISTAASILAAAFGMPYTMLVA